MEKGRIEFEDPTFRATREDAKRFGEAHRVEGGDGWQMMADFAKTTHNIPMTEAEQYSQCGKCGECAYCKAIRSHLRDIREWAKPIDMVIHCPNCKMQHIDQAEPDICECGHDQTRHSDIGRCVANRSSMVNEPRCPCQHFKVAWNNPPHKSHLCRKDDGGCGTIFRPADVPTNGVEVVKTRGDADTWPEVANA